MKTAIKTCIAAAALLAAHAQASLVQFTYTGQVNSSHIPDVMAGDTLVLMLLADNGHTGLASQTWHIADLISGSLQVGSYQQSYVDGWYSPAGFAAFATDAAGNLTTYSFYGTLASPNHTDSYGTGGFIHLYNNAFTDSVGRTAFEKSNMSQTPAGWTVEAIVTDVPEPASLALVGIGAAAAGALRRRADRPAARA
jgi:hypothetical protein